MLKSYGWVVVVVVGGGLEQFSVSPRPLGFGFGTKGFRAKGFGPGLDKIFISFEQKLYGEILAFPSIGYYIISHGEIQTLFANRFQR